METKKQYDKLQNVQYEIGRRLRKLRELKGEKQSDLGALLGITPAAYGKIEAGDRGLSSEYCILLSDYYNVSCNYILRGVEAENVDVWKKTGLSDRAISALIYHCRFALDEMFASREFWKLIEHINFMTDYSDDPIESEKEWDFNVFYAHKFLDQLLKYLREDSIDAWVRFDEKDAIEELRYNLDNRDNYKQDRLYFQKMVSSAFVESSTFSLNDEDDN